MEDFFDRDKLKAKVFLLKDGDTRNMAMVTDDNLMLIRDGKKVLFALSKIKSLASGNKKQLFPLIFGGVVAPFAFLSYFTNIFHPLLHLLFTLLGLLLFYIGWAGKTVLIVSLSKGEEEFVYLPSISKNLEAFASYTNGQLRKARNSGLHNLIFIELHGDRYDWLYQRHHGQQAKFPCLGYTFQQIIKLPGWRSNTIAINPELSGREIRFVFDVVLNEMRPEIDGPVSKNAIVEISNYD